VEAANGLVPIVDKGVRVTRDASDVFSWANEFEVLAIATTAPSHVPLSLEAIRAGIRTILLEKPVSDCLKAADVLETEARKCGCRIAVDHTRRWISAGDGIQRLIRSGVIGRLVAVYAIQGRGGMAMIGTHFFDYVRWIVGDEIARIRGEADDVVRIDHRGAQFVDRSGRAEAYFRNGVRFSLDLSDTIAVKQGLLIFVGEAGRIEVDERLGRVRLLGAGGRVWEREYVWPGAQSVGVGAALLQLAKGGPVQCTLADGKAALEAAIACNVSSRQGGAWVELPLVGTDRGEHFPFA
jgi:predicted dehydrogenase